MTNSNLQPDSPNVTPAESVPSAIRPRWLGFDARFAAAICVLLCIVSATTGYWFYLHMRYKHFAVHSENKVYRSAWLEPDAIQDLIKKYHLRTVINLCNPHEMGDERWQKERQAVRASRARLLEMPMPMRVSPTTGDIQPFVDVLSRQDTYPMLVHCQHGVTRTDKLLVIYDVLFRGMSADQSLNAMPLFGRSEHNVHVTAFARKLQQDREKFAKMADAKGLSRQRQ